MVLDKLITDEKHIVQLVSESLDNKANLLFTYFNQHCYNIYSFDKDYKNLIDKKFATYIDGVGIRVALRLFGYKTSTSFNASDLNEELFNYFINNSYSVYLIGGKIPGDIIATPSSDKLIIKGYVNGFFKAEEEDRIIQKIIDSDPDVIIVGMGVPKQELFSVKISEKLKGKTIICVGNFLEFYFGTTKRIPKVLRNLGIEWLFRMLTEPRRLWRRYIIGIPVFFFLIMKEYFAKKNW